MESLNIALPLMEKLNMVLKSPTKYFREMKEVESIEQKGKLDVHYF